MNLRIDVYLHSVPGPAADTRLDQVLAMLGRLMQQGAQLMPTLADLTKAVAEQSSVEASVETLLSGLKQQLADAAQANDPTAVQALLDSVHANTRRLADAVAANTPATTGADTGTDTGADTGADTGTATGPGVGGGAAGTVTTPVPAAGLPAGDATGAAAPTGADGSSAPAQPPGSFPAMNPGA